MIKKLFVVLLSITMMFSLSSNVFAAEVQTENSENIIRSDVDEFDDGEFFLLEAKISSTMPTGVMAGEWGGTITNGYAYVTFKVPEGHTLHRVYFLGRPQNGATGINAKVLGDNTNITIPLNGNYYKLCDVNMSAGRTYGASISLNTSSACNIVLLGRQ